MNTTQSVKRVHLHTAKEHVMWKKTRSKGGSSRSFESTRSQEIQGGFGNVPLAFSMKLKDQGNPSYPPKATPPKK